MKNNTFSMLKKLYLYLSIFLLIIQLPLFCTGLALFLSNLHFTTLLLFILMLLLFLQPVLSILFFKKSNQFSIAASPLIKKWLQANTIFTLLYLILTLLGTVISIVSFEEIKKVYLQAMPANEITDTVLLSIFYCTIIYSVIFLLHCIATLIFMKKVPQTSLLK